MSTLEIGSPFGSTALKVDNGSDSPSDSGRARAFSTTSSEEVDLEENEEVARKTHQLVIFSKQLLVMSMLVLLAIAPASFLGIGFWLTKDIIIVSVTFGVASLAARISHKVQDYFASQERVCKKEKNNRQVF